LYELPVITTNWSGLAIDVSGAAVTFRNPTDTKSAYSAITYLTHSNYIPRCFKPGMRTIYYTLYSTIIHHPCGYACVIPVSNVMYIIGIYHWYLPCWPGHFRVEHILYRVYFILSSHIKSYKFSFLFTFN